MCRHVALLVVLGWSLAWIGNVRADARFFPFPKRTPPKIDPPKTQSVAVKIEVDDKAKGIRILMPRGIGADAPVHVVPGKGEAEGEVIEPRADHGDANDQRLGGRLLVSGSALSLSCVFGGLWLVRRKGVGAARGLTLLLGVGVLLGAGAIVWANVPPPQRLPVPPPPPPGVPALPTAWEGRADVEFRGPGEPLRIILDKQSYEKLIKGGLQIDAAPGAAPPAAP